jgi:hypothetical protein
MNEHEPEETGERDPLFDYVDGDPDAIRAAAPREPSDAEWEAARLRIHTRLDSAHDYEHPTRYRRVALWLAASAVLTASAAALAWVAFSVPAPKNPQAPEFAQVNPAPQPEVAIAPIPHEPKSDPLAEFAVLPMASDDEVVLHRVPGDGWLPIGNHPLPGELALATTDDVELDDPNPAWPSVTISPGAIPMIFAAKPR